MPNCRACRDTGCVDRGGYFNPATGCGEPPYEEPCRAPGCDAYECVALVEDAALESMEGAYVPEEREICRMTL